MEKEIYLFEDFLLQAPAQAQDTGAFILTTDFPPRGVPGDDPHVAAFEQQQFQERIEDKIYSPPSTKFAKIPSCQAQHAMLY